MTTEAGSQLVLLTWIKCINDMKSTQRASFSLQEATDFAQKYKISKQALTAFLLFMKQVITSFKYWHIRTQSITFSFFLFSLFVFLLTILQLFFYRCVYCCGLTSRVCEALWYWTLWLCSSTPPPDSYANSNPRQMTPPVTWARCTGERVNNKQSKNLIMVYTFTWYLYFF